MLPMFCALQLDEITTPAPAQEKVKVKVIQNYTAIRVNPDFKEDDVQPLQPAPEGVSAVIDSDSEDQESEEEDQDSEKKDQDQDSEEEDQDSEEEEGERVGKKSDCSTGPSNTGKDQNGDDSLSVTEGNKSGSNDDGGDDAEAVPPQKKKVKSVSFLSLEPPAQDGDGEEKHTRKRRRQQKEKSTSASASAFFAPTLMKLEQIKRDAKRNQRQLDLIKAKIQRRKDAKMGKTSLPAKGNQRSLPAGSKTSPALPQGDIELLLSGALQTTGTDDPSSSEKILTPGADSPLLSGKALRTVTEAVLPAARVERKDTAGPLAAAATETGGAEGEGAQNGRVVPSTSGKWTVSARKEAPVPERGLRHTGTHFVLLTLCSKAMGVDRLGEGWSIQARGA